MSSPFIEALKIPDPERQRQAMNALPPLVLQVAELSFPEYFALLQLRGTMPNPTTEQVAKAEEARLGLTREAQLALVWDGLQLLQEKGACALPGTDPKTGEQIILLHPFIQLASEAKPLSDAKLIVPR